LTETDQRRWKISTIAMPPIVMTAYRSHHEAMAARMGGRHAPVNE
jgi:hypothetical protein